MLSLTWLWIAAAWLILAIAIGVVLGAVLRKRRELDELLEERYEALRDDQRGESRDAPR